MDMLLMPTSLVPIVQWGFLNDKMPQNMSFSRLSSAQRTNATGRLETLATGVPRFSCDAISGIRLGLLYEPQRTNLCPYSQSLSQWVTVSGGTTVTKTDNVYTSPDGTQNASQVTTEADSKGVYRTTSGLVASTDYAVSGFVKSFAGSALIKVGPETTEDTSYNGFITVSTDTGNIASYGSKTYDRFAVLRPDGWCYFRYRVKSGAAQSSLNFIAFSSGGSATFSIFNAQIEALPDTTRQASSPIITSGSAVTRAADQLSFTLPNGVSKLRFVFDDNTTQDIAVSAGNYTMPTDLKRAHVKQIYSV